MKMVRASLCAFAIGVATLSSSTAAWSLDCEKFLRMHSLASRAQFECNFSRYSNDILAQAKECNDVLSEERTKENLMAGTKLFDDEVAALGLEAACSKVLETLPLVVTK